MQGYLRIHTNEKRCYELADFLADNLGKNFLVLVEFGHANNGVSKFNVYKVRINSLIEGLEVCEFWEENFIDNYREVFVRLKLIEKALTSNFLKDKKILEVEELIKNIEPKGKNDNAL